MSDDARSADEFPPLPLEPREASPYLAPALSEAAEVVYTAELVLPPTPPRPRIWTALLVSLVTIALAAMGAGLALIVAAVIDQGEAVFRDPALLPLWMNEFALTIPGLLVVIVPGQLVFLGMALGAAFLSPQPFRDRLCLRRGDLPLWVWGIFLLATPLVGYLSSLLMSLCVDELSDSLKMLESILRTHSDGFLWGLVFLIALQPGFVEELLFRGYLQGRLLQRWHPAAAILVSALIFSLAHMDPLHAVGVLPLGLWLGAVAWRADTVWPAMLCHAANNGFALLIMQFQPADSQEMPWNPVLATIVIASVPAFLCSLVVFALGRRR